MRGARKSSNLAVEYIKKISLLSKISNIDPHLFDYFLFFSLENCRQLLHNFSSNNIGSQAALIINNHLGNYRKYGIVINKIILSPSSLMNLCVTTTPSISNL